MKIDQAKIKKLWDNKQTKALITLGIYTVVLIVLFIIYYLSGKYGPAYQPVKEETIIKEETIKAVTEGLLKNNYQYNYQITSGLDTITYKGIRTAKDEEGYKETAKGVVKYYIDLELNLIYELRINQLYPLTDLYLEVDYSLINFNDLVKRLDHEQAKITTNDNLKTYQYQVIDNENIWEVEVIFADQKEVQIIIKTNDQQYQLEYSKIGEIDDINRSQYYLAN